MTALRVVLETLDRCTMSGVPRVPQGRAQSSFEIMQTGSGVDEAQHPGAVLMKTARYRAETGLWGIAHRDGYDTVTSPQGIGGPQENSIRGMVAR